MNSPGFTNLFTLFCTTLLLIFYFFTTATAQKKHSLKSGASFIGIEE
jgi:hypothetical protein